MLRSSGHCGNPVDSNRAVSLLERQEFLCGEAPERAIFDGGFASKANVEGTIPFLKRAFGLDRRTWSGAAGFRAYVHSSVLAADLLTLVQKMGL